MLVALSALFLRIISNPCANTLQKKLAEKHSATLINLYSYAFLSLFVLLPATTNNWNNYGYNFWLYVVLAGILCTLGSICLIKALQYGEMSVLAPINSYKCIVGLIFGFLLLGETPSAVQFLGLILIIFGSRYLFETTPEGFSFKLFKRKDILLRILALVFTGCEAAILKKIILISSPLECFILWCFSGFIFSAILMFSREKSLKMFCKKDLFACMGIAISLGIMQLSTNIVFKYINVGLSLALFQLSSIIAVILGYKMFNEKQIRKKLIGTLIMIIGSCLILILK